ncbi:HEAT repeat domain-containing protein [Corallococcus macrosporus]|uniref:HEAT repeat domain-containing protein n=1 Tax=Corallococcus macrosporus TaxID=35 RepID=A0ABS3DI41_9BACT|nr:HEAT repeat domain-containing protein [Corallococcus macrosporus]MBN8231007.1 HEAT repeat domain-containing protein [Corallococcus macrosporus]
MSKSRTGGGRAMDKGLSYQDDVTVWVALQLMFVRNEGIERIELEPESQEDIEVLLPAGRPGRQLSIQVKCQGKPWGPKDFVDLVGIPLRPTGTRGPKRRSSPVERLAKNPGEHYVLITDATLDASLQSLEVEDLLGLAPAPKLPASLARRLPPGARLDELVARIKVLKPMKRGHFQLLTEELLKRHLHVPGLMVKECREALAKEARARMPREAVSHSWTRQDIVATARLYKGALTPTEEMEDFVAPRNFEEMKSRLANKHQLVLLGPPGVGKTLVARKLAYEYQVADEPFAFLRIQDPAVLRERLEATREPTVFFVEDPFGPDRPGDKSGRWLHDLPALLDEARPDKKLIVMSRLAILRASSDRQQFQQLRAEAMHLDIADYEPSARWRILQNKLRKAQGWQRALVDDHRDEILESLHAPLSIKTFAMKMRQLEQRSGLRLRLMLQESAVDKIASIVAQEIRGLSWSAVPSALILWSLLAQEPVVARKAARSRSEVLLDADRSIHVDIQKLLEWMLAAGWLTEEPDGYRAHPQVTAGLELLMQEEPAQAASVLSALLKGLCSEEAFPDVLELLLAVSPDALPLSRKVHGEIESWLRIALLTAEGESLPDLYVAASMWLRGDGPMETLVRALYRPPLLKDGFRQARSWLLPRWPDSLLAAIRSSSEARQVMERFIRYVLPTINNVFHEQFVRDLDFLGWHFPEAFAAAVPIAARGATTSLSTIVLGAVNCEVPPFNSLIELISSELRLRWDKADVTPELKVAAEQGHLDIIEVAAIEETDLDDRLILQGELERVVAWRRAHEGYTWLLRHPRCHELIFYWCIAIRQEDASLDEFSALLNVCETKQRWQIYQAIGRARHRESGQLLLDALNSSASRDVRVCLRAAFEVWSPQERDSALRSLRAQPEARKAALVAMAGPDLAENEWSQFVPEAQEELARILFPEMPAALSSCIRAQVQPRVSLAPGELVDDDRKRLYDWARSSSPELSCAAISVLAAVSEPVAEAAAAAMKSPVAPFRKKVIQALASDRSREATDLLGSALQDPDWRCRTAAVLALAPRANAAERQSVLATAKDPSWLVRKACVTAIRKNQWHEGLNTLFTLLSDEQDLGLGYTEEAREHGVARSAAQALVELAPLPESFAHALLDFLRAGPKSNRDAMVHQQLMVLFMFQNLDGVFELLVELLQSPMRRVVRSQVHYPVRKAAAWALFQQLIWYPVLAQRLELASLVDAALHPDPVLSGGACLVLGRMGPMAWPGAEPALGESEQWERAFLLGAEWIRAHHTLPPGNVRALLPPKATQCLEWLLECDPVTTESWGLHPGVLDWLTELSAGGSWCFFIRYYLQLYFFAPPHPAFLLDPYPSF